MESTIHLILEDRTYLGRLTGLFICSLDMAGQAAKKVAKNAQTKTLYFAGVAVGATALNCAHRFLILGDFSFGAMMKVVFLAVMAWLSYKMIIGALNLGVGYELWLDLFIINSVVQVLSVWTSYVWLLYLTVPGYGLYHVGGYLKDWIFARRDESVEPPEGKQQKQKIKHRR